MSSGSYEKSDVNIKRVLLMAVLPALTFMGSILGVHYYFSYVQIQEQDLKSSVVDARWLDRQRQDTERLTSYGVVDAGLGRYAIPIERAMLLIANEASRTQGGRRP